MPDTAYLFGVVVLILVAVNIGAFYANVAISETGTQNSIDDISSNVDDLQATETSALNILLIFTGILGWSFGLLPFWLDLSLIFIRLFGYYLLARLIRGV